MPQKTALITGAGPAGLTTASELLKRTDIQPSVFENTGDIARLSRTLRSRGRKEAA